MASNSADILVEQLKEFFPSAIVKSLGGVYNHVSLEINDYIFSDFDMSKLIKAKELSNYGGFYMIPLLERESKARHFVMFHERLL